MVIWSDSKCPNGQCQHYALAWLLKVPVETIWRLNGMAPSNIRSGPYTLLEHGYTVTRQLVINPNEGSFLVSLERDGVYHAAAIRNGVWYDPYFKFITWQFRKAWKIEKNLN